MKITKKRKQAFSEYRILKSKGNFSIIQVYYDFKGKIVGYTDYIIPHAKDIIDLKLMLSSMISCSRKDILTEGDLEQIKQ